MADFLKDLGAKLDAAQRKKVAIEQQLEALKAEVINTETLIASLNTVIASEEREIASRQTTLALRQQIGALREASEARRSIDPSNLTDVLLFVMRDREAHSLDDLAERARQFGHDFGDKNPLRVVNATLLGSLSANPPRVTKLSDGYWSLPVTQ